MKNLNEKVLGKNREGLFEPNSDLPSKDEL